MATTTYAAIRDAMRTQLETATTPTSDTTVLFRAHSAELPFERWAVANPQAAYRRYAFSALHDLAIPEALNTDVRAMDGTFDLRVAYPTDYRYGGDSLRDRDDIMAEDYLVIDASIGGNGGYANIANATVLYLDRSFDDLGDVTIMTITYRVVFYAA